MITESLCVFSSGGSVCGKLLIAALSNWLGPGGLELGTGMMGEGISRRDDRSPSASPLILIAQLGFSH